MIPKHLILATVLSFFPAFSLLAQSTLIPDIDIEAGTLLLTGPKVREVYGPGIKAALGPKLSVGANQRVWVRIHGGLNSLFKPVESENRITNNLRILKAGTQLQGDKLSVLNEEALAIYNTEDLFLTTDGGGSWRILLSRNITFE